MLIPIPFHMLVRTNKNVRKVDPDKTEDKELMASIEQYGVVENLVVFAVLPDGVIDSASLFAESMTSIPDIRFAVMAGARRFGALELLLQSGGSVAGEPMTVDFPVWCRVAPEEDATAISLIENLHRADMHPADQFVAFEQLSKDGKSDVEIAKAFGKSKADVRKLKRLGAVAPALIDLFRKGKFDLDDMMAFAFTDDQERQLACYHELKNRYIHPSDIRRFLSDGAITSDDRMVKFVGLKAYKKAGGRVQEDLFGSKSYLMDQELLKNLADEKLNKTRESCLSEGWAWCEVVDDIHGFIRTCKQVDPDVFAIPDVLQQRMDAAKDELTRFQEKRENNTFTGDDEERENAVDELLDQLQEEAEQYQTYSSEQKAVTGCALAIGYDGKADISAGLVRKSDIKKLPAQSGVVESVVAEDAFAESAALKADLGAYYLQAFQAALLGRDDLADDMLVYTMASELFEGAFWERLADVRVSPPQLQAVGIQDTHAAQLLRKGFEKLALGWLQEDTPADRFRSFVGLSKADKRRIKTYCVALTAMSPLRGDEQDAGWVARAMLGFDVAQYWQPTTENYFSRISKNHLLTIGASVIDAQWADDHEKAKKGALADLLPTLDQMKGWMPDYMQ